MTGANLEFRRASGSIGAYVEDVDIIDVLNYTAVFKQIYKGLLEHEVLFFEEQEIEPQSLEDFAGLFGTPLGHGAYDIVEGTQYVQILESTKEKPSMIQVWHSDMTFINSPPTFTMLHSQVVPSSGGDTMWASARAAYESLSPEMKNLFDGLEAEHDFRQGFKESLAEPEGKDRLKKALENYPKVSHPVVLQHPETGKRSLFVNALFTVELGI